jgi:hypothetical protein
MLHTSGGSSYATGLVCVETRPLMNVIYAMCGWPSKPLPDPVTIHNMYLHLSKWVHGLLSPVILISAAFFLPGQCPNNISHMADHCCIQGIWNDYTQCTVLRKTHGIIIESQKYKTSSRLCSFHCNAISWRHRQPQSRNDALSRACSKNRPASRQRRDPEAVFVHNTHTNSPHFNQD